ncbi:hypothetical protein EIN_472750 [Entamoeba invadens IP1]|uniref:Uncharacterized protein n=1 Tax=Entamoeba invadens IP1 TaxID=370355 RepID=A0A0A1U9U6_ENTIV|nr:hypothetical protein EIN_472750 [Entamoeba invadens IP1]ELP89897.1 hypothetical protein EIN_472750 [Entamoeba invadens IP1]|eukprot:XP_004256668.1 hypothetical protein EIN_472750 [Entamoeba invadens IP1]
MQIYFDLDSECAKIEVEQENDLITNMQILGYLNETDNNESVYSDETNCVLFEEKIEVDKENQNVDMEMEENENAQLIINSKRLMVNKKQKEISKKEKEKINNEKKPKKKRVSDYEKAEKLKRAMKKYKK